MRVDLEPWDDNRVRTALKMCQDREKILQLSYYGQGDLSIDAHIAPVHPEYSVKPIPPYDPEGARALLEEYAAEKGIELPLKVTLATKNDLSEPEIAQALKELARRAASISRWTSPTRADTGIAGPRSTLASPPGRIARWAR